MYQLESKHQQIRDKKKRVTSSVLIFTNSKEK